ncbi:MAG: MBL fold metallo-hydrolase [Pseudomonadota bacterium]|nr:MBL fold metallo-hydrolase [Pseudomonadota bacterium]
MQALSAEAAAIAAALPVADAWFRAKPVAPGVTLIDEPHVDLLLRANLYLVEGSERDMLIDSGMGIAPLAPFVAGLRKEPGKPLIHVLSHAHIDHMAGSWEFDTRLIHPREEADLRLEVPDALATLFSERYPAELLAKFKASGYRPLPPVLIDALPHAGYDPAAYAEKPAPATMLLEEGDRVELGDRDFLVLHLPGHSDGGIGLLDEVDGTFFSGDAIYDGPLILAGDLDEYRATLRRLRELEVGEVHGGHNDAFGQARMREICDDYLARWGG